MKSLNGLLIWVEFDLLMFLDFFCVYIILLWLYFNENVYDLLIFFYIIDICVWIKIYILRFVVNVSI